MLCAGHSLARTPVLVLHFVELLEQLHSGDHLLRQRQLDALVGRPEAGGQHLQE